jgi:hypothetical protein
LFTITGVDDVAVASPAAPVLAAIVLRLVLKLPLETAVFNALDRVAVGTYNMIS